MKITLSKWTVALFFAISTIAYQSITSMTNQSESTSGISILSLLWLGVALLSIYLFLTAGSKKIDKGLNYLLLFFHLYAIFVCLINGYLSKFIAQPTFILSITFWIFIYYIFYDCARNNIINIQNLSKLFFVLIIVCFILLVSYYNTYSSNQYYSGLNVVYYLIFALPFTLINENKRIVYISLVLTFIGVILSCKRGALVSFAVAVTIWFLNTDNGYSRKQKTTRILAYLLVAICFVAIFAFAVSKLNLDIWDRMKQFIAGEDQGGSGRFEIWTNILERIKSDNILMTIIGRGHNSTKLNLTYASYNLNWAHNDFLQILMDYGIIGLTMLILIIQKLCSYCKYLKASDSPYRASFMASVSIFVICCFISMVLTNPQWFLAMAAFWGCIIGDYERKEEEMNSELWSTVE